jgi:NAD(P) transhydrogenase subunit beta
MIEDGRQAVVDIAQLIAAVFFIFGLKFLSRPRLARRGNQISAIGMAIAIIATYFSADIDKNHILIAVAIIVGAAASSYLARIVKMTEMPQMVAAFNGMGGATAALVALSEFQDKDYIPDGEAISIVLGVIIGGISFAGSVIAFGKLQGLISGKQVRIQGQRQVNLVVIAAAVVVGVLTVMTGNDTLGVILLWLIFGLVIMFGASTVMAIGGADMPVVIAILNSMTGIAAMLTGLVLGNQALVVAGALVGASGSYLTMLMAKAMNRSVPAILFGSFGGTAAGAGAGDDRFAGQSVRQATVDDVAVQLAYANDVIVVPGYGLAVAQAHHAVRELADLLTEKGVRVRYAIHPVAGRMPGHMNVLLAEANVPYEDLYEMEAINDDFANADVAIVIGANDVTNPAAKTDPSSPIYGMPILNVEDAKSIVVLKRSMSSGYAGIENELFYNPKTTMLFGDAKDVATQLVAAVKEQ